MQNNKGTNLIILPMDGCVDEKDLIAKLKAILASPTAGKLIGIIKLNDALHIPGVGPNIIKMIKEIVPPEVGIFIDLKIPDVLETDKNILLRYKPFNPDIVTVTSTISAKSLLAIKEVLPNTKIALVDTLTDIAEEELLDRYHMNAAEKIIKALEHFDKYLGEKNPIELVVSSPKELKVLREKFGDKYKYITPGIRSPHMAKDHQQRVTSAYDALKNGAWMVVMGAQVTKGNPDKGISAEESQLITLKEIEQALGE